MGNSSREKTMSTWLLRMQMVRTQALTVLLALLANDNGAVMANALHASGLPMRVLQDVVDTPHSSLLQVCYPVAPCSKGMRMYCMRSAHNSTAHPWDESCY